MRTFTPILSRQRMPLVTGAAPVRPPSPETVMLGLPLLGEVDTPDGITSVQWGLLLIPMADAARAELANLIGLWRLNQRVFPQPARLRLISLDQTRLREVFGADDPLGREPDYQTTTQRHLLLVLDQGDWRTVRSADDLRTLAQNPVILAARPALLRALLADPPEYEWTVNVREHAGDAGLFWEGQNADHTVLTPTVSWDWLSRAVNMPEPRLRGTTGHRATGKTRAGKDDSPKDDPLDRFAEAIAGFARRYSTGRRGKATADMVAPFVSFYRHGRDVLDRTHEGRVALGMISDLLEQVAGGEETYHDRGVPCLARYPGGKCQSSDWIVPLLPAHRVYVEMFGGVASVLLRKPRSEVEIYNDVSQLLSETMAALSHRDASARLQTMALDYSANGGELSDRFFQLRDAWHNGGSRAVDEVEPDLLMRVLVFLYGLRLYQTPVHAERMTYAGGLGPGQNALQMQRWLRLVLELSAISARLTGVVVYDADWRDLAKRLSGGMRSHGWKPAEVLVYCDPPYPETAVSEDFNSLYGEGGAWSPEDHTELIEWMIDSPYRFAVSGMLDGRNESPYRALEKAGFKLHRLDRRRSTTREARRFTECLWVKGGRR